MSVDNYESDHHSTDSDDEDNDIIDAIVSEDHSKAREIIARGEFDIGFEVVQAVVKQCFLTPLIPGMNIADLRNLELLQLLFANSAIKGRATLASADYLNEDSKNTVLSIQFDDTGVPTADAEVVTEVVQLLIKHGLDVNHQNNDGETIIMQIIKDNEFEYGPVRADLLSALIASSKIDMSLRDQAGDTLLQMLADNVLTLLWVDEAEGDVTEWSEIDTEIFKLIIDIDHSATAAYRDEFGDSFLHTLDNKWFLVRPLIQAGCTLTTTCTSDGDRALMHLWSGDSKVLEQMLYHGLYPDILDWKVGAMPVANRSLLKKYERVHTGIAKLQAIVRGINARSLVRDMCMEPDVLFNREHKRRRLNRVGVAAETMQRMVC